MHASQLAFIQTVAETFTLKGPVHEFGTAPSIRVTEPGSSQVCIHHSSHTADQGPDRLSSTAGLEDFTRLPHDDRSGHTVLCVNALQHVPDPCHAMREVLRVLAPGGVALISSVIDPEVSGSAADLWRPTPAAIQSALTGMDVTLIGWQGSENLAHTVYAIGCKPPVRGPFLAGAKRFPALFQARLERMAAAVSWPGRLRGAANAWLGGRAARRKARDFHRVQFVLHMPIGSQLKYDFLASYVPQPKSGGRLDVNW